MKSAPKPMFRGGGESGRHGESEKTRNAESDGHFVRSQGTWTATGSLT